MQMVAYMLVVAVHDSKFTRNEQPKVYNYPDTANEGVLISLLILDESYQPCPTHQ